MINIGNNSIDNIFVGEILVDKIYLGTDVVWEHETPIKNYLKFTALDDGTFTLTIPASVDTSYITSISYSTDDGETWTTTQNSNSETIITTPIITSGNSVLWKGNGNGTALNLNDNNYSNFTSSEDFTCSGNIMSLLYLDGFTTQKTLTNSYAFAGLFKNCSTLITADNLELSAMNLTPHCYDAMFQNCTNLTTVPELPATALADACYYYMFEGCSKIEEAQEILPATSLVSSCYNGMFLGCSSLKETPMIKGVNASWSSCEHMFSNCTSLLEVTEFDVESTGKLSCNEMFCGCTSLTTVPDLKIKTIQGQTMGSLNAMFKNCTSLVNAPKIPSDLSITSPASGANIFGEFKQMFMGCTSLTTAPELPNTRLSSGGCQQMFAGCTSLTTAPELPATTLQSSCYHQMFYGCTSLTEMPELPATTLANDCYMEMFKGCTSLTATTELAATTLASNCYRGMFDGCTSLATAPELPATTLATRCYRSMFGNCTNLEEAPELPATTLANDCYYYMFGGCTSLTEAPEELPATTLAQNCYYQMFYNCTSLTTAPELPATTLTDSCYYMMFWNCTSLITAPELPATTLANNCYRNMFYGCTSLTEASTSIGNSSTTIPNGACHYMFEGCTSLTTAPTLPATTLTNECYHRMFRGCTSLTIAPSVLPATTLADGCYKEMFVGCKSLTTAPVLPATTLINNCYYRMFEGCANLTIAPELPATTLVDNCYHQMFKDCNKLNYIKCLATDISATNCTREWVYHVQNNSGCTFVKASTMGDWTRNNSNGIPTNWTVYDDTHVEVTGVTISTSAATINKGNTYTLTATVLPLNADDQVVSWSTSDSNVATVSDGIVTGVGCGNATITVTTHEKGYTATCNMSVENHVTSVDLNTYIVNLAIGNTYQLEATVSPSDACDKSVTWSSSNENVATVDSNGLVSGVTTGSATVTVTTVDGGFTKNCSVTVSEGQHVTGVTLSDAAITINEDETYVLTATVMPNDAIDKSVTWTTSNATIATVDSNGVVSGVASGDTTITVTTVDGGFTAQCSVSVTNIHDYSKDYFTIESLADSNQIKMQRNGSPNNPTLSYSLDDGETWTTTTISGTVTFGTINTGDKIIFKGSNNKFAIAWDKYNYFTATKQFKVYGNIMSIFNGDNFKTNYEFDSSTGHHCSGLFRTTYLVDASNLILPALTIYSSSYNGMFRGATALQHGPQMLATTPTGTECCSSMFEGCINLEEAIDINFTTLVQQCCMRMFLMNRNSKITTPKMTKSPILRCNTAAKDCYKEMFKGNGNLNEITCLLTTSTGGAADWVKNAGAATGTFYKSSLKNDWPYSDSGVPTGWTIEDYIEE